MSDKESSEIDLKTIKLSFFENFKFLYSYKFTLILVIIWGVGYNLPSILWGYFNNREYFNIMIRDPFLYIIIPATLIVTSVVHYGIDTMKDFCYGKRSIKIRRIFKSETIFKSWADSFFKRINNNKIIVPIIFICGSLIWGSGIFNLMVLKEGNTFGGANVLNTPILLIAYLIGQIYWYFLWVAGFLGLIIIILGLYGIAHIGKDINKLSINNLVRKYQIRLDKLNQFDRTNERAEEMKGEEYIPTYSEFQSNTRIIGAYLFRLFFRCIILAISINIIGIIPLQLELWEPTSLYIWIIISFFAIIFFIIPQFSIHKILKNVKEILLDTLKMLQDNLSEQVGDTTFAVYHSNSDLISKDSLYIKLKQLEYIKNRRLEIKETGTWSYDFPEVLKLVGVASLSIIPLLLEFFPIL